MQVARGEGFRMSPWQRKKRVGQYGPPKIFLENGKLYYRRDGRAMVKRKPWTKVPSFLMENPSVKIEIEMEEGRGIAMVLRQPNT
jgi:hypothetical protein